VIPFEAPAALTFDIDLNPIPLGRPQFVRGRAIMPARSLDWRKAYRTLLAGQLPRAPLDGLLDVRMRFWRRCRSVMDRGDLSNLVKAVEDACNPEKDRRTGLVGWPGVWCDDRQIIRLDAEIVESGPKIDGRVLLHVQVIS
jgi:Holliday junction resolvase RusA-like endonuclease